MFWLFLFYNNVRVWMLIIEVNNNSILVWEEKQFCKDMRYIYELSKHTIEITPQEQ